MLSKCTVDKTEFYFPDPEVRERETGLRREPEQAQRDGGKSEARNR